MTSEWEKWQDVGDSKWTEGEVEEKDGYQIHTQHAIRGVNQRKPASIEESIRKAKESHRKIFEENRATDGFPPTALIIDPEGLWTAVCCPDWADMKEDARRELHRIALRERAVALVWGSDSYFLERDPSSYRPMESPSRAKDRKEVFILTTIWPDGTAEMEMYPFRVENRKLIWLEGGGQKDAKVEQRIVQAWAPSTATIQ